MSYTIDLFPFLSSAGHVISLIRQSTFSTLANQRLAESLPWLKTYLEQVKTFYKKGLPFYV